MDDCIFCKIIEKEIPGKIVYEDDMVIAFLDISPLSKGHVLVAPKKHVQNLALADSKTLSEVMSVVQKLSLKIKDVMDADGIVLMENLGITQEVEHMHVHIIPTYEEHVAISLSRENEQYDLDEIFNQIID